MATNPSYSQKVINCRGRACAKCGYCRDWYWTPSGKTKRYTKRPDAPCTAGYCYGISGYGPGCAGCCLHFIGCFFGNCTWCCINSYYGGGGYGHGGGIANFNGFLSGGLANNIDAASGIDVAARRRRKNAIGNANLVADIVGVGDVTRFATSFADLDRLRGARIALVRAHHDDGHLCECSDNQQ
jgi:hypothetical protein